MIIDLKAKRLSIQEKIDEEKKKSEQVEYLRQTVGSELFKRSQGMSYSVVFKALDDIKQDVLNSIPTRGL